MLRCWGRRVVLLCGWTALVWTTRVGNILGDDDLSANDQAGRLALAGSFTLLAALAAWGVGRGRPWARTAANGLAVWTVVVWAVRVPGILLGGHSAAFVVVHLVLAAVSLVLAAGTRQGSPASTPSR